MTPKIKKPKARDLRPIALMNSTSYSKSLNGNKIEKKHLKMNNDIKEIQGGFTKGSQIEDSLSTLQYCIEYCNTNKKPLIITSLEYRKAFDSVKTENIVKALMQYKVHSKII